MEDAAAWVIAFAVILAPVVLFWSFVIRHACKTARIVRGGNP